MTMDDVEVARLADRLKQSLEHHMDTCGGRRGVVFEMLYALALEASAIVLAIPEPDRSELRDWFIAAFKSELGEAPLQ